VGQCILRQTALFRPRGLFGLLYGFAVLPFHSIVFRGMLLGVKREALQIAVGRDVPEKKWAKQAR